MLALGGADRGGQVRELENLAQPALAAHPECKTP